MSKSPATGNIAALNGGEGRKGSKRGGQNADAGHI